jgi:hypothetical protein
MASNLLELSDVQFSIQTTSDERQRDIAALFVDLIQNCFWEPDRMAQT